MNALKGALGFFTQIPIGRDAKSFENLRRNIWILPVTGLVSGTLIAVPSYFLSLLSVGFVAVLFYILVEGINHIDGLADFGDAVFANNKFEALKDTKLGSGGATFIAFYIIILSFSFQSLKNVVYAVILSQVCAKTAMLILLTTAKPLWDGLAKTMMELGSIRDLIFGLLLSILISAMFSIISGIETLLILTLSILVAIIYRCYVLKKFGGVNGDIIGALNCITFAFSMLLFTIFHS